MSIFSHPSQEYKGNKGDSMKTLLLTTLLLTVSAFAAGPLTTAEDVKVEKYIGKWYALKALPQFFTRHCIAQTAEYEVIDEKTISVLNTCIKKKGKSVIDGEAKVVNPKTNAELVVTFDSFFTRLFRVKGDYTIIKLDDDYRYVLVGSKDRKSLWLMSRTTEMPEEEIREYLDVARAEGFAVEKLVDSKF